MLERLKVMSTKKMTAHRAESKQQSRRNIFSEGLFSVGPAVDLNNAKTSWLLLG